MRKPPPDPWIEFPKPLGDGYGPPEAIEQTMEWLHFMSGLSRDELLQRERDRPAPPGWETLYKTAAQWHENGQAIWRRYILGKRNKDLVTALGGGVRIDDLIAKIWQSTTLK